MPRFSSIMRHLQPKQIKRLLGKKQPSAGGKVAVGDRARNARDWTAAVEAYREALAINPSLAPIWVQLGHALKESGDARGAIESYERAISVDPNNSDTALQLGHAWKIAGDLEAAKSWYEKALQLPPGEMAAAVELQSLGVTFQRIEQLLEVNQQEDVALESGPLLWDISEAVAARSAGRPVPVDVLWSVELALALAKLGIAVPVFADAETMEWRCLASKLMMSGRAADLLAAFDGVTVPLPSEFSALVVTPTPHRSSDDTQWQVVASLQKIKDVPLVAFVPSVAMWDAGGAQTSPSRLVALDQALAACSLAIVPRSLDRDLIERRLRAVGRGHLVSLALTHPGHSLAVSGTVSPTGGDLVLCPPDEATLAAIAVAHRAMDDGAKLSLLADKHSAIAEQAEKLGFGRSDDVVESLDGARSLVLPAGCSDASLWAAMAQEQGVPVIAARTERHLWGHDGVDEFVDFGRPEGAAAIWREVVARPPKQVGAEIDRWARAMRTVFEDLRSNNRMLPASEGFAIRFGRFYAFTRGGSGLRLRSGGGWHSPAPHGSTFDAGGASFLFRLKQLHNRPCKLALLIGAPGEDGVELEVRGSAAGGQAVRHPVPRPWGWLTFDLAVPAGNGESVEIVLRAHGDSGGANSVQPVLTGFTTYPSVQDGLWHQFLDQASRGKVPELAVLRSWADRSTQPKGAGS